MDINELTKHQDEYPLSPADPEEIPQAYILAGFSGFWRTFAFLGAYFIIDHVGHRRPGCRSVCIGLGE